MAWKVVASFPTVEDAYIVKGMLESENIPVEIRGATLASVYPMTDTWAPIELLVPDSEAIHAMRLIAQG